MSDEELALRPSPERWPLWATIGHLRTPTRGWTIQRVFSHDVYHVAEVNEVLTVAGLSQIDLWA